MLVGHTPQEITGLQNTLFAQRGTPQQVEDWTAPDTWIETRLDGSARTFARSIREGTNREVNPRYLVGHWRLVSNYELLTEDADGLLQLSDRGGDFLVNEEGPVTQEIDELEGLVKLLELVSELGPVARAGLLEPFRQHLAAVSNVRADSTVKSYLWARLRNLTERQFLERSGQTYTISDRGLAYLEICGREGGEPPPDDEEQELRRLIKEHTARFRDTLRATLMEMDPYAFEHLIKTLLEAMGYQDVEVTSRGGDGGVDVIADIELGITQVREVVQAKRHARNIQRSVLDALRGSLHRFRAVRGTIITTSDFARGTKDAAFEAGAAPITLIDGEKLIDLLIKHRIGVQKKSVELLELDASAFNMTPADA